MAPFLVIVKSRCHVAGEPTESVDFAVRYFDAEDEESLLEKLENEPPLEYDNPYGELVSWRFEKVVAVEAFLRFEDGQELIGFISQQDLPSKSKQSLDQPWVMRQLPPILQQYVDGLHAHNIAQVAATVADSLVFRSVTRVLDKPQFLAMLTAIYTAFPDWRYEQGEVVAEDDGSVSIRWRQGGTHTGTLALAGRAPIAATGRSVQMPEQRFFYRVAEGQIVEIRPEPIFGGAPEGIFAQIGGEGELA